MNLTDNTLKKFDNVSFKLTDELKDEIYKEIKDAQDFNSPYNLSIRTEYSGFHLRLENYYTKKGFKNKPNKTDYLAWILLLTYPKEKIKNFQSVNDLNLEFVKLSNSNCCTNREDINSDFEVIDDELYDDVVSNFTCICSQSIENIRKLKNKFTGISFQVGCECIKRHGLVSKEELAKFNERIKITKERKKAIKEGLPVNYHTELRKASEELKIERKKEKDLIKNLKEQEKIIKKEKKEQEEEYNLMSKEDNYSKQVMMTSNSKKCMLCKKEGIYSKYIKLTICNICVNNKDKNKISLINNGILKNKREYKTDECINCEINFSYRYRNILKSLCGMCEKEYKILKCKLCTNKFIDDINSSDVLCNVCDDKSKNCIDCKNRFISENTTILRCDLCQYRFSYKIKVKKCQECDDDFEIKESENWKTFCSDCFKNNLFSVKCNTCDKTYKKLPNQEWKKTCTDCYYKSKTLYK
jgi:hypothetical protein